VIEDPETMDEYTLLFHAQLTTRLSNLATRSGQTGFVCWLQKCTATSQKLEALDGMDFVKLDLGIVRALAYYNGNRLRAVRTPRASCGAILRRRAVRRSRFAGGVDLPALGFRHGNVVLAELFAGTGLSSDHARRISA